MRSKISIFFLLVTLLSCQDHAEVKKNQPNPQKFLITSLQKEDLLREALGNAGFVRVDNKSHSTTRENSEINYLIVTDSILKVLQSDSVRYTYTFRIDDEEAPANTFENLILKRVDNGYIGFILRYESDPSKPVDFTSFSGKIKKFDLEGTLLSEMNLANGNLFNRDNKKGKTATDCSEVVRFAYEAYDGTPCDNIYDGFDDGCHRVLYVEECGSGSGNSGGTTGGFNGNVGGFNSGSPGNFGGGGTHIPDPGGLGGGGSGSGSTDNGGISSGGSNGNTNPGNEPIGVLRERIKWPVIRFRSFKSQLSSESQLFLENNPAIADPLRTYLENQVATTTDSEYPQTTVDYATELIDLAVKENDVALSENQINISLITEEQGYFDKPLDDQFSLLIDPYTDLDLTNTELHDQLITYLIVRYNVLKELHPRWGKAKLLWETTKDVVHIGLDAFGLVPVIGEGADLVNGVIYTIEGDGLNATLSYASAIPVVGYASTATKYGLKIVAVDLGTKIRFVWKVTADGVSFGSDSYCRKQLRKVLGLAVGDARQAHHIIPLNKQRHAVIQKAAQSRDAFHLNEALNGIPLPTTKHNGSHGNYDDLIQQRLDAIDINQSAEEVYSELMDIINDIRTAIQNNPKTPINQLNF